MPHSIHAKTILNRKKQRDSWFLDDYTLNPYSGCSFNCLFCYTRGSKYGEHMEQKLALKENAPELLEKELRNLSVKGKYGIIVLSSATDPYLHFEKEQQLTRRLLEIILKYRFPVHIITRSDLVMRDFDLLEEIGRQAILPQDLQDKLPGGVILTFSFSGLDDHVAKIFEPGATPPSARLEAMRQALERGINSGVSLMPLLPFITDTGENLEHLFSTFSSMGTRYVMPATITLFGSGVSDSKTLTLRAVEKHYPHLLERYKGYFANGSEMPAYYRKAFGQKMKELGGKYGVRERIVEM